jgi:hypothetical protein
VHLTQKCPDDEGCIEDAYDSVQYLALVLVISDV